MGLIDWIKYILDGIKIKEIRTAPGFFDTVIRLPTLKISKKKYEKNEWILRPQILVLIEKMASKGEKRLVANIDKVKDEFKNSEVYVIITINELKITATRQHLWADIWVTSGHKTLRIAELWYDSMFDLELYNFAKQVVDIIKMCLI